MSFFAFYFYSLVMRLLPFTSVKRRLFVVIFFIAALFMKFRLHVKKMLRLIPDFYLTPKIRCLLQQRKKNIFWHFNLTITVRAEAMMFSIFRRKKTRLQYLENIILKLIFNFKLLKIWNLNFCRFFEKIGFGKIKINVLAIVDSSFSFRVQRTISL